MPTTIRPFFNEHRAASEADIWKLQGLLQVVLPEDYSEFLLKYNGGYPDPCGFRDGKEAVDHFFGFCQRDGCLWCTFFMTRDSLPDTVLPIGVDGFGNLLCLGIAKENRGKIYFWDHETSESVDGGPIAESFSAFIDSLRAVPPLPPAALDTSDDSSGNDTG